jgi:hypothetical protein
MSNYTYGMKPPSRDELIASLLDKNAFGSTEHGSKRQYIIDRTINGKTKEQAAKKHFGDESFPIETAEKVEQMKPYKRVQQYINDTLQQYAGEYLSVLHEIAFDEDAPTSERGKTARDLLDRAGFSPVQKSASMDIRAEYKEYNWSPDQLKEYVDNYMGGTSREEGEDEHPR